MRLLSQIIHLIFAVHLLERKFIILRLFS